MKILLVMLPMLLLLLPGWFFFNNSIKKIQALEVKKRLDNKEKLLLVDVRTKEEYNQGHIPSSVVLPLNQFPKKAEKTFKDKDKEIIVYCRSGGRSRQAAKILKNLGFTNIKNLGGIQNWPYDNKKK